jgi:hypothetical protein
MRGGIAIFIIGSQDRSHQFTERARDSDLAETIDRE